MNGSRLLARLLAVRSAEVELLRSPARIPAFSWALLGLGLLAAALAALLVVPQLQRAQAARIELAQRETHAEAKAGSPSGHGSGSRGGADREITAQATAVARDLHRPWRELFDRLEASQQADVHLLSINVDPGFGTVQIAAESREIEALLRYGQRLASAAPVHAVDMTHYEWRDASGVRVVSATLVAHLQGSSQAEPR
jgi:hypothetical protein